MISGNFRYPSIFSSYIDHLSHIAKNSSHYVGYHWLSWDVVRYYHFILKDNIKDLGVFINIRLQLASLKERIRARSVQSFKKFLGHKIIGFMYQ